MSESAAAQACVTCGEPLAEGAKMCLLCGSFRDGSKAIVAPKNAPSPDACNTCGSDQVRRVLAIVQQQTWTSQSSGTAVGIADDFLAVGVSGSVTSTESNLAAVLAPPQLVSPAGYVNTGLGLLGVAAGIAAVFGIILIASDPNANSMPAFVAALVFGVLFGICYVVGSKQQAVKRQQQEVLLAHWKRLYYCSKCHRVFDPISGDSDEAETMEALLRRLSHL